MPSARLISGMVTLPSTPLRATCKRHRIPYSSFALSFIPYNLPSTFTGIAHRVSPTAGPDRRSRTDLEHVELKLRSFAHHASTPGRIEREFDFGISDARDHFNFLLDLKRQGRCFRAVRRGQGHLNLCRALVVDLDLVNQAQLIDIYRNLRIVALMQCLYDSGLEVHAFKCIHRHISCMRPASYAGLSAVSD